MTKKNTQANPPSSLCPTPCPVAFFHFYSFQNFTLPNPQTVPGPVLAPVHGWQPSPTPSLASASSAQKPAQLRSAHGRQATTTLSTFAPSIPSPTQPTHKHTKTRIQGKSSPVLPTDVAPANTGTTATTLRCRLVYFSHLFFQLSQLHQTPTHHPGNPPPLPLYAHSPPCCEPKPKAPQSMLYFLCVFHIRNADVPNATQHPSHPTPPSDKPSDEPTDPAGLFFTMPAKDKSNNNSNSHSTLLPLTPLSIPPRSLTASRSQPLVLLSVALLLLLHFCWRRAKKATKIIAISPPPPSSCRLAQHKRLAHSPPTHLILSQSAQLTTPHTLGQSPKNPPHSNTTLPPHPPLRTSHAQCLPNHSQNSALSCLSTHLPPPSALATADSHSLLSSSSLSSPRWFVDAADVSVAVSRYRRFSVFVLISLD